jgi:hypothetical protein
MFEETSVLQMETVVVLDVQALQEWQVLKYRPEEATSLSRTKCSLVIIPSKHNWVLPVGVSSTKG